MPNHYSNLSRICKLSAILNNRRRVTIPPLLMWLYDPATEKVQAANVVVWPSHWEGASGKWDCMTQPLRTCKWQMWLYDPATEKVQVANVVVWPSHWEGASGKENILRYSTSSIDACLSLKMRLEISGKERRRAGGDVKEMSRKDEVDKKRWEPQIMHEEGDSMMR